MHQQVALHSKPGAVLCWMHVMFSKFDKCHNQLQLLPLVITTTPSQFTKATTKDTHGGLSFTLIDTVCYRVIMT